MRKMKKFLIFICPVKLYIDRYAKHHLHDYEILMWKYGAPDEYITDAAVRKDFFEAFRLYGLPVKYYLELDFFELKDKKERDRFVPPGRLVAIWKGINDGPSRIILDEKSRFAEKFSNYFNRDWLFIPDASFDEFEKFCARHAGIIAKKNTGAGGFGIKRFEHTSKSREELKEFYERFSKEQILLEEQIIHSGILHDLNPDSVNCVRVCTLRFKDHVEIFQCFLKIGAPNACVDNILQGGGFASIDPETGVVNSPVYGKLCSFEKREMSTEIDMSGFQIPFWKEVKMLVSEAAEHVKDLLYVSWDVAIDESGKLYLIEGNTCGNSMWLKRGGEWPRYLRALKSNHKYLKYLLTYNYALKFHTQELMSYKDL